MVLLGHFHYYLPCSHLHHRQSGCDNGNDGGDERGDKGADMVVMGRSRRVMQIRPVTHHNVGRVTCGL